MDYAAFDAIMREGIIVRWIVPAALVAATLVGVAWYIISKHRNGIASDRSLGFTLVMAAACIFFTLFSAADALPMMRDLKRQDYASVHGMYECKTVNQHGASLDLCVTLENGKIFNLMRPKPIGLDLNGAPLPEGEYAATVWYGVESHCIVAFIPDEPIPDE